MVGLCAEYSRVRAHRGRKSTDTMGREEANGSAHEPE